MRKRLVHTNWIRQWHPQRTVAVGKPDGMELEREALTAGRCCTESRGGRDRWKSLVWWAHSPTIRSVREETPWEQVKNVYLWENLNPKWTREWHSLPPRLVHVSRNCVYYCRLCFSPLCGRSTLRAKLCVAPVGDRVMFRQTLQEQFSPSVLHADRQELSLILSISL